MPVHFGGWGAQNRVQRRPPQRRSFCVHLCSGRQSRYLPLSPGLLRKPRAGRGLARAGHSQARILPLVSPITRPQLCWLGSQTSEVAGTSYSASHLGLLARGPLSCTPGKLGNTGSFPLVGGTRLLRSGGPCIRLTQLAFPVSPDPSVASVGTTGDSEFVGSGCPAYPQRGQDPAAVDDKTSCQAIARISYAVHQCS